MLDENSDLLVVAELDGLARVTCGGIEYQILFLLEDGQRDMEKEENRMERKARLLGTKARKIGPTHFFFFPKETFSASVRDDMQPDSKAFQETRMDAGEAYGEKKWDDPDLK